MRYSSATGLPIASGVFVSSGSAGLSEVWGLAFGPDRNLYVASQDTERILRYNGTTGTPVGTGVFATLGTQGVEEPFGVKFGPDGNLYVTNHTVGGASDQVRKFDGMTGNLLKTLSDPRLDARGLTFGPDSALYAIGGSGVLRYDGRNWTQFVSGVPGLALDLAFGPDGNLYVTSTGATSQVLRYDGMTGMPIGSGVFVSAGSAGLSNPFGLAFGPDGNLYVTSRGTNQILRYDGMTGLPIGDGVFVSAGSAGLDDPVFLTFTPEAPTAVPEPASLALVGVGAAGLCGYYWRRQKRCLAQRSPGC
jgi:DNA-binding beta-propeller fold protein YncE